MASTFGIDPASCIHISAKTGLGVEKVLQAIIKRIPPPKAPSEGPLKALLFDSLYDRYRGVISLLSIQQGVLRKGEYLTLLVFPSLFSQYLRPQR